MTVGPRPYCACRRVSSERSVSFHAAGGGEDLPGRESGAASGSKQIRYGQNFGRTDVRRECACRSASPLASERSRCRSALAVLLVSTFDHPAREDPMDTPAVFLEYAQSDAWIAVHLGQ